MKVKQIIKPRGYRYPCEANIDGKKLTATRRQPARRVVGLSTGGRNLSLPWKPSAYSATRKPTPLPTTLTSLPPPPPPPPPPPRKRRVSDDEDVKFTLMSNSSGDIVESAGDVNVSVSPSDELFFKGGFPYFSVSRCHLLNGTIFLDERMHVIVCGCLDAGLVKKLTLKAVIFEEVVGGGCPHYDEHGSAPDWGLGELAPTKLIVELADRTIKRPKGVAENILVGVDKFVFPIDFVVLDMPEDIKVPLILRRLFLSTAHAKIDVFKRKIALKIGNDKIVFKSEKPTSNIIKRVCALGLRERMKLDLDFSY
ncbi:putative reverse transcriptase domain-containing protein [Tanacetum coccineum]